MQKFSYTGVIVTESAAASELVLFSAPAQEIEQWSGIPQRRRIEGVETAGFQREQKERRVAQLAQFLSDPSNAIQNPLLAATQDEYSIQTTRHDDGVITLEITVSDAPNSLAELLRLAIDGLEKRMPTLADRPVADDKLASLREDYDLSVPPRTSEVDASSEMEGTGDDAQQPEEDPTVGLFEEETQVVDFYDELTARAQLLSELGTEADGFQAVGGFTRDFLESLTRPVVLVDGQHRLQGALAAVSLRKDTDEVRGRLIQLLEENGDDETLAEAAFARESSRVLPVSLMLNPSPAEHVFQFVVVNQKATPMSSALLGTIVSTSLSTEELEPIRVRLQSAGIEVEGSQAIAYMTRSPQSPFYNLVATGVTGDRPYALPWSVLGKLVTIVRDLRGANQYHTMVGVDFAKQYRDSAAFKESGIFSSDIEDENARMQVWSAIDGPWRSLFISFFSRVKDKFADETDMQAHNAWGTTRSNVFNMISLTILLVDYFNWLHMTERRWTDIDDIAVSVDEYLEKMSSQYFARDWRMAGTKKDQPIIRRAWGEAWAEYRVSLRLPRIERYNPASR